MSSLFFTTEEIDDMNDVELRSKFFNITNDVRMLEGMQAQLCQARMAQQQLCNEIGERQARKAVKRVTRLRGPGF